MYLLPWQPTTPSQGPPLIQPLSPSPSYENPAWPCSRPESCPRDTGMWFRRLSPSFGSSSSNPLRLWVTQLLNGVSVCPGRTEALLQDLRVHYPDVECLFPSHLDASKRLVTYGQCPWDHTVPRSGWIFGGKCEETQLCLNVCWLVSVTFSGGTNQFSDFPSG